MEIRPVILVVDDNAYIRNFLVKLFVEENYHARSAADADEALAMVSEQPPDVVLVDAALPNFDGESLVGAIRHRSPRTGIILMGPNRDGIRGLDIPVLEMPFRAGHILEVVADEVERIVRTERAIEQPAPPRSERP